jgi:hypothetical protein
MPAVAYAPCRCSSGRMMSVIAVVVLAQKFLPAKAAIDLRLALAIVGLGIVIVVAPSSVPGLTPM